MTKPAKSWEKVIDTQFGHINKGQLKALIRLILSANLKAQAKEIEGKWRKQIEKERNRFPERKKPVVKNKTYEEIGEYGVWMFEEGFTNALASLLTEPI